MYDSEIEEPEVEEQDIPEEEQVAKPPDPWESVAKLAETVDKLATMQSQPREQPAFTDTQPEGAQYRPPQYQVPRTPMELLPPSDAKSLRERLLMNDESAINEFAELSSRHARMAMEQQAGPIVFTQAQMFIAMFKSAKQATDPNYAMIVPKFDAQFTGVDITPLVTRMDEVSRNNELEMRWAKAALPVLQQINQTLSARAAKPEPTLTAPTRGGAQPGSRPAWKNDPWLVAMQREHNLTDAQMKEIEEAS